MYIIGITGPIAAGKTLSMQALARCGVLPLDCDDIYHELLLTNTEMTNAIKARFACGDSGGDDEGGKSACDGGDGADIRNPSDTAILTDGAIDRKKLGKVVFNDPAALADLSELTHKYVLDEVDRRILAFEKQGGSVTAVSAIKLIEFGYNKKCDITICITAPIDVRISRIMERDRLTREEALSRINAQQQDSFYRENSDYTLHNDYENTKKFEEAVMNTYLIDKWFNEHADEMVADLGEIIAINSVRGQREDGAPFGVKSREALSVGQKLLEKHGFEVNVFEDMVITANLGPTPPKLGILTHLDVVEAGEHWDTDPFELILKEGKLYGRGVMDNKGPAIATMYAAYCVRELFPDLTHGVQLIFGSSEETGFDDIAQYMKKNAMPPNVFSPDAAFPVVNIEKGRFMPAFGAKWEKDTALPRIISIQGGKTPNIVPNNAVAVIEGISKKDVEAFCEKFSAKTGVTLRVSPDGGECVVNSDGGNCVVNSDGVACCTRGSEMTADRLKITASGVAVHASRPHLGNNAQTALVEMLAAMPFAKSRGFECIRALARLFPHGDHDGNAIGLSNQDELSGKTTVNFGVLRYDELEFSACFDARTAIRADENDALEMTREVLSREGMKIAYYELKKSHHTPEDTPFVQALLRVYEQYTGLNGKCIHMGGLTYVHDIPGGVAFGCTMSAADNNVHGANEFFDQKQFILCAKMFAQAIVEICK